MSDKRVDESSPEPEIGLQPASKKQLLSLAPASSAQRRADDPLLELNMETAALKAKMEKVEEELKETKEELKETKAEKKQVEQKSNQHEDELRNPELSDDTRKYHLQMLQYLAQEKHDLAQKEQYLAQEKHDLAQKEHDLLELFKIRFKRESESNEFVSNTVTGSMELSQSTEVQAAFKEYLRIAKLYENHEYVLDLNERCEEIIGKENAVTPFIFLEGSSGIGKTQMAINLIKHRNPNMTDLNLNKEVLYLTPFALADDSSQLIYQYFNNPSRLFRKCWERDIQIVGKKTSVDELTDERLFCYGFIKNFVEKGYSSIANIYPVNRFDSELSTRIVVILDEFLICNHENDARFIRNLFRVLGYGVVLAGTDTKAANLFQHKSGSRANDNLTWCYIFAKYPPFVCPHLESNLACFVPLAHHSRPLFSQLLISHAQSNHVNNNHDGSMDIEAILSSMYNSLVAKKSIFQKSGGKLGQFRLFLNSHYAYEEDNASQDLALINEHFAVLVIPNQVVELKTNVLLDVWMPVSKFRNMNEDVLMYLSLMGGPQRPAFVIEKKKVPALRFYNQLTTSNSMRKCSISFSNAKQKSNDGMKLEAFLSIAVCLASHTNGVMSQVSTATFLCQFVYELSSTEVDFTVSLETAICERIGDKTAKKEWIPYLSPPGLEWPEFVKALPGCKFGNMERAQNSDGVDLLTDVGVSGEGKDHSTNLNLQRLQKIISRVPCDSKLHVVLTRNMQQSYFATKSFDATYCGNDHVKNMNFYSINVNAPECFHLMTGLPPQTRKDQKFELTGCVVVFVVL